MDELQLRKILQEKSEDVFRLKEMVAIKNSVIFNQSERLKLHTVQKADLQMCIVAIQTHNDKPWYKRWMRI
jgi:hypothetical protein